MTSLHDNSVIKCDNGLNITS